MTSVLIREQKGGKRQGEGDEGGEMGDLAANEKTAWTATAAGSC